MIVAVVAIVTLRLSASQQEVENQYVEKAKTDFAERNYQGAMIAYERLAAMGVKDKPDVLYRMAKTYEQMALTAAGKNDHFDRCRKIMNQIAPPNQDGYGPAHEWQAQYLILTRFNDEAARALIQSHLERAIKSQNVQDKDLATYYLGMVYLEDKRYSDAELKLAGILDRQPLGYLLYSRALSEQKKTAQAKVAAKKAADYFQGKVKEDRLDANVRKRPASIALTRDWASSLMAAEQFQEAIDALSSHPGIDKSPEFPNELAKMYFVWQGHVGKNSPEKVGERLELIHAGLKNQMQHEGLLNAILSILGDTPESAAKAREILPRVIAIGPNTAAAHLLLGMDYLRRDDQALAIFHLNAACDLDRNFGTAINNLAVLLSKNKKKNDPDLDRALDLINFALERSPDNLVFRDTRGRIYLEKEEWDLARIDLQQVVPIDDIIDDVHLALAKAYDHLDGAVAQAERLRHAELEKQRKK